MQTETKEWGRWRRIFEARSERPLPRLGKGTAYADLPPSVARSLAIFQLGESGGGTVVEQAKASRLAGMDDDYCESLRLFVEEEHRHANLLAMCVRMLGGDLINKNWTAHLFVFFRRLIGLRTKIMVLLAAEVVGICYYHLLARHLPEGRIRRMLEELVVDEQTHLDFHCAFLRMQTRTSWHRRLFRIAWRGTMFFSTLVVLMDHFAAIRALGIGIGPVWKRSWETALYAERLIEAPAASATTTSYYCDLTTVPAAPYARPATTSPQHRDPDVDRLSDSQRAGRGGFGHYRVCADQSRAG